jgi:aspartate racemase
MGIILGCTEIPLLVKKEDVDIQLFDTAIIHAEAALKVALNFGSITQKKAVL